MIKCFIFFFIWRKIKVLDYWKQELTSLKKESLTNIYLSVLDRSNSLITKDKLLFLPCLQ